MRWGLWQGSEQWSDTIELKFQALTLAVAAAGAPLRRYVSHLGLHQGDSSEWVGMVRIPDTF